MQNVKGSFFFLTQGLDPDTIAFYRGVIIAWSTVVDSSTRFDIPDHSMICRGHGKAAQAQEQAQALSLLD